MRNLILTTHDRHRIALAHHDAGHDKALILAHGFFNNKDAHLFRGIALALSVHYDIFALDFRGHGQSSGLFSWTSRETADIAAATAHVKSLGYKAIGIMGFSLGGAISIIAAAADPELRAVIAVASPSDFWKINFHFWEPEMLNDLKINFGPKGVGKGIRPGNPLEPKISPVSVVGRIAPRPVLFIHGSDDWLIKPSHSRELYAAAHAPKSLEIITGAGHAEIIFEKFPDVFTKLCVDWLKMNLQGKDSA